MLGLDASALLFSSTVLPGCMIRTKPPFSLDTSKCLGILSNIMLSYFVDLACCHFLLPYCSLLTCGIQNRLGFIIPFLNAQAACISKLYGLTEIFDPNAIPSSTPSLPMDTSAHFSLPSYFYISQTLPKRLYPPSWLHWPLVHYLS